MKIGITERGDASLDYSWVNKLSTVNGAIVITKNLTDKFLDTVYDYGESLILHATMTGYGNSIVEPNVPSTDYNFKQLRRIFDEKLLEPEQVVVRIDPIIPTEKGIKQFRDLFIRVYNDLPEVQRIRISVLDMYPHVKARFEGAGIYAPLSRVYNGFEAKPQAMAALNSVLKSCFMAGFPRLFIEACAEPKLTEATQAGCISMKDLEVLKMYNLAKQPQGGQRKGCMCLACKTELLSSKNPCAHGCLYCYWKDK